VRGVLDAPDGRDKVHVDQVDAAELEGLGGRPVVG
jgi:hypothetical protein